MSRTLALLFLAPAALVASDYVSVTQYAGSGCTGSVTSSSSLLPYCTYDLDLLDPSQTGYISLTCLDSTRALKSSYNSTQCNGALNDAVVIDVGYTCTDDAAGSVVASCMTGVYTPPTDAGVYYRAYSYDEACSEDPSHYRDVTFMPAGVCLPGRYGPLTSAIATCTANEVTITTYTNSTSCKGSSTTVLNPTGCGADAPNGNWLCVLPSASAGGSGLSAEAGAAVGLFVGAALAGGVYALVKYVMPKVWGAGGVKAPLLAGGR